MLRLGVANWLGGMTIAAMGLMLVGCAADTDSSQVDDADSDSINAELKGGNGKGGKPAPSAPTPTSACSSINGSVYTSSQVSLTQVSLLAGQRVTAASLYRAAGAGVERDIRRRTLDPR